MIITTDGNIPSRYAHSFNVMKMAQGFYDTGEKVTLVSLLSYPNWKEKRRISDIYDYYGVSRNISIELLPVFNKDFFRKTIGAKDFNVRAARYIAKQKPDFVFARSYLTQYYCVKFGIPSILETHTTDYENSDLQKIYEIGSEVYFRGLVTISENIKKEHVKRGIPDEKILVLEDGVDLAQFDINDDRLFWRRKLNLSENKKIVAYCGGLYKEKGIEDILLTARKLKDNRNVIFILIGGMEHDINFWKAYCRDNYVDNVSFIGFAKNSDVPKYLKAADLLIMPYNTRINYEVMDLNTTSPLKLFEYMASQRPIVSTDIPVITKIVKHEESALLAEPNNIDMLADYVLELIGSNSLSSFLVRNAYEIAKNYTWKNRADTIMKRFLGCYN